MTISAPAIQAVWRPANQDGVAADTAVGSSVRRCARSADEATGLPLVAAIFSRRRPHFAAKRADRPAVNLPLRRVAWMKRKRNPGTASPVAPQPRIALRSIRATRALRHQCLHALLIEVLHELVDQPRERH